MSRTRGVGVVMAVVGLAALVPVVGSGSAGAASSMGELLTDNLFMGTEKVEIGARPNGSFGSDVAAPTPAYHPRPDQGQTTGELGFRGNPEPGSCAWTDGTCTQGDFFVPGSPYEAFAVQIGASGTPKYNTNSNSGVAGSFTSVSPSTPSAVWQSSADVDNKISVRQDYSLPTYSWVLNAKVTFTNTTGSAVNDIYYLRGVDPDNCKADPVRVGPPPPMCTDGGGPVDSTFDTLNTVAANGASGGTALVTATQTDGTYLGVRLASTKGKAFVKSGSFAQSDNVADVYNGANPNYTNTVGQPGTYGDQAVYVVDKIDSLAAGESVSRTVQYVLKDGVPIPDGPPPTIGGVGPSGPASPGELITITGTDFVSGATVKVGGEPCTDVTVVSSTQITCKLPSLPAGVYDLVITNPDGQTVTIAGAVTSTGPTPTASPSESPSESPSASPTPGPTTSPTPTPSVDTGLVVKAKPKGKRMTLDEPNKLVSWARSSGPLVAVRAWCELNGNRLPNRLSQQLCGITIERGATAATTDVTAQAMTKRKVKVTAQPQCSQGLSIHAVIVAKQSGHARAEWKRTWRADNNPRVTCSVTGTG